MRYVSALRRPTRTQLAREEGSILFALLAILIIAAVVSALFVRTVSSQRTARFDRDFQEVVHHADAGVQQALFMLEADTEGFADWEPGDSGSFELFVDDNPEPVDWTIERLDSRTWEITSTSELNGVTRTIVAKIEERRRFFASAFAHLLTELDNQNYADTYKSNNNPSLYGEDGPYWPRPGRLGVVGSNTEVELGGKSSQVDGVQLWDFGEGDTVADRCTGSGNTKIGLTMSEFAGLENPDHDPDGELTACEPAAFERPDDSLLGPYSATFPEERELVPTNDDLTEFLEECGSPYPDFDNQDKGAQAHITELEPVTEGNVDALRAEGFEVVAPQDRNGDGDKTDDGEEGYYCFDDMTFGQDTTVAGTADDPVIIYAIGTVDVKGNSRKVNCENCPNTYFTTGGNGTTIAPPVAAALQVYLVATDSTAPQFRQSPGSQFGGTMYGPESFCGNTGSSQAEVYGSMICGTIDITGGWKFHYDDALTVIGSGDFVVANWREETG